jgi:hypothetical protein
MANQNHALMFGLFLNRLIGTGDLEAYERNPNVLILSPAATQHFVCGRDVDGSPFLGFPVELQPFFPAVDWMEAAICKKEGLLILEARDTKTNEFIMGLGFRLRVARSNVFFLEGKEDVKTLNLKVFMHDEERPGRLLFPDENELIGIVLKPIDSISQYGDMTEAEYSKRALERTGMDNSFSYVNI